MSMKVPTGAEKLIQCLEREGVDYVFGLSGGAAMPIFDALVDSSIKLIMVRHEQGAAHMADGYARASGRPGVVLVTSGPGATNTVTGLLTAQMDSVPMIVLTGQTISPMLGKDAFQEADVTGITYAVVKHSYLVKNAADIPRVTREAFHITNSGRPGPVLIDLPKDVTQGPCEAAFVDRVDLPGYDVPTHPDSHAIETAAELLKNAKRPVLYVGHGSVISGAGKAIIALAETLRAPIVNTLLGKGAADETHPLHLGMLGMHGTAYANKAVVDCDLIMSIGARWDDRITGKLDEFCVDAVKIHIDIDPAEFNKNVVVDVSLAGDLSSVLRDLLPKVERGDRGDWLAAITEMKGDSAVLDIQNLPDTGHLYAAHVINDIWRLTEGQAVVVTDVGQHQMWEAQYYHHQEPRSLITSGGLGTMGFALPAAIGAKLARPDAEVWVIAGDGGFQMTSCELATIAQEKIKINVAIINNGYLGMVRQWQEFFYERRYAATPLFSPDFAKLAEAFGLRGAAVSRRQDVVPAIEMARAAPGAVVIDFQVEQEDTVYPMVPAGADLDQMIRRPSPSPIVETADD